MSTKNQPKKTDTDPAAGPGAGSEKPPADGVKPAVPTRAPALKIVSERDGFRRAGLVFGRQPVLVKRSDLTRTQIEQLKAEPLLTVSEAGADE